MPQHYDIPPARLERARCFVTRCTLGGLVRLMFLVSLLLPKGHPVRLFLAGRLPQFRAAVLPATIPAARKRPFLAAAFLPAWVLSVVALVVCFIGDLSSRIPLDPFGLPDTDLGLGRLLGLGPDAELGQSHLFSHALPWHDGSLAGAGLLVAAVACVYTWRPKRRRQLS